LPIPPTWKWQSHTVLPLSPIGASTPRRDETDARVGEARSIFDGEKVHREFRVDWTAPDGTTGSLDSLELAEDAVAEWRTFFNDHGLNENS
jgi:hypothetical protein